MTCENEQRRIDQGKGVDLLYKCAKIEFEQRPDLYSTFCERCWMRIGNPNPVEPSNDRETQQ